MYYDLLVHVDLPEEQRFVMALNNMANYLAALADQPCRIVLLANGGAVSHLVGGSVLADRIRELQTRAFPSGPAPMRCAMPPSQPKTCLKEWKSCLPE